MSNIHVNRNRQSLGQFTPREVAEGLASGELLPTDLGWQEPMETWRPLSEFSDLPVIEAVPPGVLPAPAFTPAKLEVSSLEPAWERRKEAGFFQALWQTIRQVFTEPAATFSAMKQTGGFGSPLGFYVLVWSFSALVVVLYELTVFMIDPEGAVAEATRSMAEATKSLSEAGYGQYAEMVSKMSAGYLSKDAVLTNFALRSLLIPFIAVIQAFIVSGIYHGFLFLVGGARHPFETTFRVVCYASGAISLLQIVPMVGIYLVGIWTLVVLVIGLKYAHKTDFSRATFAVLLPFICCCGLMLGLVVVIGWALTK